ncbi:MFS transporter [Actinoallomurus spadix]|uniref:MFS transporter n=1 Tax=Actinoallomurus spadix TaxID=79912 RepID=A0ABP3H0V6_9ACTN|nr:MFS transporter [Actinoallomurus spadix]MCO5986989.1 MFS transporter [Actinoallomurus spadix]
MVAVSSPEVTAPVTAGLRRLLWGRGISALGDGLWFTIWALYFTRVLHLSPAIVGAGMAVAGGAGLAAAVPLGALADRASPRAVLVVVTVVRGAAMAAYLLVDGAWGFLLVTVVFVALANGGTAVRTALVAALVPDTEARLTALGAQRSVQHIGYAIGAGLGAVVQSADRPGAYLLAIAGNAVSFAVLAALTAAVPEPARRPPAHPSPGRASQGSRPGARAALADRPYVTVMAVSAVLSLCWAMLSTGLPLWISHSTRLPLSLSGAVVVISSVGIALLQVPAGRLARTTASAARTGSWAGVALAAACALLATTAGGGGLVAAVVVIAAALLHLAGELGYVAAGWGLSVSLMREEAKGAYQGVSEAATATVQIAAPAIFTSALGAFGARGWLLVAGVFLAVAAPLPALARHASRTR